MYEAYFETILKRTLEMRAAQLSTTRNEQAGILRSGLNGTITPGVIPPDAQAHIAKSLLVFKQKFFDFLNQVGDSGQVVTTEKVQNFFKELKNETQMMFTKDDSSSNI
jgi:hypothetical protein